MARFNLITEVGIQVGVAITILVRQIGNDTQKPGEIFYLRMREDWRKEQKYAQLEEWKEISVLDWKLVEPDRRQNWLTEGQAKGFESFLPMGLKERKSKGASEAIFQVFSLGVASNRDAWVFNYSSDVILANLRKTAEAFQRELHRFNSLDSEARTEFAPEITESEIKWTDRLLDSLKARDELKIAPANIRGSSYRPFTRQSLYFDHLLIHRRYQQHRCFPTVGSERENRAIGVTGHLQVPFSSLSVSGLPCLDLGGRPTQFFPFYNYDEDGTNRRENITDWALAEFRKHYCDQSISKWDIFHYTYALLHQPEYRTRYAANLKRELPRIPMAREFRRYAEMGAALMKLHIEYERQAEYPLERKETGKLDWRVEKMALSKDKTQLRYNGFLTLSGIPPEVYEYRLGNRSALEWVVDQYRVSTDARSGIVNDPNREDDPEYIVRLIGQVMTVSLETVRLVGELAGLGIDQI